MWMYFNNSFSVVFPDVSSPSGVWGGAPAEMEFGAFKPQNLTSGGNNYNDFPENQLTKKYSVDHQDEAILQ